MVRRYEILILTVSEITQDEMKDLELSVEKMVNQHKGMLVSFERWGKYRLSYPVKKNDYGVYFLVRFDIATGTPLCDELKILLSVKFNDIVMRHMITFLDKNAPSTYQRPRSLEEGPVSRETSSLFSDGAPRLDKGDRSSNYYN